MQTINILSDAYTEEPVGLSTAALQSTTASSITKILGSLFDKSIKYDFVIRYAENKPLREKAMLAQLDKFLAQYKEKTEEEVRPVLDLKYLTIEDADEEIPATQFYSHTIDWNTGIAEAVFDRMKRSIVDYIDSFANSSYGFDIKRFRQTYSALANTILWDDPRHRTEFLMEGALTPQGMLLLSIDRVCSNSEIVTLHKTVSPETVVPIIAKALLRSLAQGFQSLQKEITIDDEKRILQETELYARSLFEKYHLANSKTKHEYFTLPKIKALIDSKWDDIVQTATTTILSDALLQEYTDKSVFLGHVAFLAAARFYCTGSEGVIKYIIASINAYKEAMMKEGHESKQMEIEEKNLVAKQKTSMPYELVETETGQADTNKGGVTVQQKIAVQDKVGTKAAIKKLLLNNENAQLVYEYIEKMVGSSKEIRLGTRMQSKGITTCSEESWNTCVISLKSIVQINTLRVEEYIKPLQPNGCWHKKAKKLKQTRISDEDVTVDEAEYKDETFENLIIRLGVTIPNMSTLQEKIKSLPKDCILPLKRALFCAQNHPAFLKDKKVYIVIKFKEVYRFVITKETMEVKDYGIYHYHKDYNKLWAEMVAGK